MDANAVAQVYRWLNDHAVTKCAACGAPQLDVKTQIAVLVRTVSGRLLTPEVAARLGFPDVPMLPLVSVSCRRCAHVMHFAANALGVG